MDDGDRLWRAIRHRPHSRRLRQVYADWLEEHGDPRSEFIRLQDRALPEDPSREAALLRAHELEWLGPMAGHLRDWGFAGGLLEYVCVETPVFLAHAEGWVRRPGLLGVHLRRLRGHVADVAACPALARLPYLFLGDNDLTTDDVRTLLASRYIRNVRVLYLQSNRIDNDGFEAIANAPALARLRELSLSNNDLQPALRSPADGPLRRLRAVHLAHNHLDGDALGGVLEPSAFPALREAHVMMNATDPGAVAGSPAFARLRLFSATLREGADDDLAAVAGSPHVRGLRRLALDFYQSDPDRGVEALAASGNFPQLRGLTLTSAVRRPETLTALGRSRAFPRLRSLNVSRNVLVNSEPAPGPLAALLGGPVVRRLHTLGLQGWPLDDACVRALGGRGPLPLRDLRLSTVPASPDAWADAGTALKELVRLDLVQNPPGVLAALAGAGVSGLRSVALDLVGEGDADALRAFPALTRLRLSAYEADATGVFDRMLACPHAGRWLSLTLGGFFDAHPAGHDGSPFRSLVELVHGGLTGDAAATLAGWPGLGGLRRLLVGRVTDDRLAQLAASPHWGDLTRLVVDDQGGFGQGPSPPSRAALHARLGGRVAFNWRASPRGVIVGGWPHADT